MKAGEQNKRWGIEQRLEFIEFRLFWEGGVNRSDITNYFGVSVPQASNDLARYQERAPHNIVYDTSGKRYLASKRFKPIFRKPDADHYLSHLSATSEKVVTLGETWLAAAPTFDTLPYPHRRIEPAILRELLAAIRNKHSMHVHYQSLTRADATWRWITPHAFASDGLRWHVRAFCHQDRIFKDFLLPRFLELKDTGAPGASENADTVWQEFIDVKLVPHPQMSPSQRRVIALDFGMEAESVSVKVRLALLYYFLKRLNLDGDAERRPPKEQHIVLGNKAEVRAALKRSEEQTPLAA
ncbi:WYL domain-containing protein [Bradyrhizobium sp. CCGUVB14]|uniref:WYL domain-containing protein n=1 Tax=Bradyrhizobium sp. CCGUVB14 TaxID=2949628 RepID=UPI0020B422B8|nr:WYL domain-containing protein [Bradyrhizobium sp. CCGUVB14]MCP3447342.1 WYL domain-containing protein [Bradyrhizobium sp. CCGUVB14]